MGSSCSNLSELNNACYVSNCTESVRGLSSNSASPSDTWVLTLKPGVHYESEQITSAFMKFWVSPETAALLSNAPLLAGAAPKLTALRGLDYELRVYRDVIRPLVDADICPHFIRYLGSGWKCRLSNLARSLNGSFVHERKRTGKGFTRTAKRIDATMKKEVQGALARNVLYMLLGLESRPPINYLDSRYLWASRDIQNTLPETLMAQVAFNELRYNVLLAEMIPERTMTLDHVLISTSDDVQSHALFQVMTACYAMSLCKMNHNDLHVGNIWVERRPSEKTAVYQYGTHVYTLTSSVCAKVYDFDRSYVQRMGANPFLGIQRSTGAPDNSAWPCQYSQCNMFIPQLDMAKVLGFAAYVARERKDSGRSEALLRCMSDDPQLLKKLEDTYNPVKMGRGQQFMLDPEKSYIDDHGNRRFRPLSKGFYSMLHAPEVILHKVAQLCTTGMRITVASPVGSPHDTYICRPRDFSPLGAPLLIGEGTCDADTEEAERRVESATRAEVTAEYKQRLQDSEDATRVVTAKHQNMQETVTRIRDELNANRGKAESWLAHQTQDPNCKEILDVAGKTIKMLYESVPKQLGAMLSVSSAQDKSEQFGYSVGKAQEHFKTNPHQHVMMYSKRMGQFFHNPNPDKPDEFIAVA